MGLMGLRAGWGKWCGCAGIAAWLLVVLSAGCANTSRVEEAEAFLEQAEARLATLWVTAGRAAWVQANFITEDTTAIAADAQTEVLELTMELAAGAARFDGVELPDDLRRKLLLLKTSITLAAPADPELQAELSNITTSMASAYGKGVYCPDSNDSRGGSDANDEECLDLTRLERIMAESRNTDELLDVWRGWRTISPPMRSQYQRFVELGNAGARDLGFADLGDMWRSGYDMPPDEFVGEVDRLWEQVSPFYDALQCHVRTSLADEYGSAVVPLDEPIPAHLLGNMWSQSWANIYDLVGPAESDPGYDLTERLRAKRVDELEMVRLRRAVFQLARLRPVARHVLAALAVHQAGRPRRRLPCQRLGYRPRIGRPDQDVHRHQ